MLRSSGARPLWTELRRDITGRRARILLRLRGHLVWLEGRQALLQQLPAERIVPEVLLTNEADARVRAEVAQAIADLNAVVRHHNLVVTATSLHLAIATLDGLINLARAAPPREGRS